MTTPYDSTLHYDGLNPYELGTFDAGLLFVPPTIAEVPPVGAADDTRFGARLFRYYQPRQRGVAVFKMTDGTYRTARAVPGLSVTVLEPSPPLPEFPQNGDVGVVNDALAWSWYNDVGTEYPLTAPTVSLVYYGGHAYPVSSAEAQSLTLAGLGAYLR